MSPWFEVTLRTLAGLAGAWVVGATFLSAIKLVVVPRGGRQRITMAVFASIRRVVEIVAGPSRDFATRDRWYSMYAPVSLVAMPFVWLFLITALCLSCVDRPFSGRTALCLRQGFLCLQRIADYFGIEFDPDPQPDAPISVTRREFDLMIHELRAADVPLKADLERAWLDFDGWRVNYDVPLIALCRLTVAPEGRWSSDRLVQ